MKLTVLCLFAVLTVGAQMAGAQSTTEHLPTTDAEKIADALRAAPSFITDGATIAGYPASKGGEWRVLLGFTHNGWWGRYIIRLPGVEQMSQWFLVLPLSQNAIKVK